jgi:hypothetical protein
MGETAMTSGFQNQNPITNLNFPKVEPKPQHGQTPDKACLKLKEKRTFQPRPGH